MNIEVNGVNLYYEVRGQGRPLILVHGNGEDHTIFEEAVSLLQFYYTCYLVDSRGHGKSSPVSEFHYQDMADDYAAFIQKLQLKNVAFYGFSDGGIIGLLLSSQSSLVEDLIISGANTHPLGVKKWVLKMMKVMYFFKKDPLTKLMLEEPDISEKQLRTIQCRTLVLAGENDLILSEETKRIARNIENAEMIIVKDRNHGNYIVHNDEIAKLLLDFLNKKENHSLN